MAKQTVPVPDIGGAENVDVIEVCVAPGDTVAAEDSLIVLESDKASMDVPAPFAGKVVAVLVKEGDQVSEGTLFIEIETDASDSSAPAASAEAAVAAPVQAASVAPQNAAEIPVKIPDIGGSEGVDVIELCVAVGDTVAEGDSLIVLESDKASMEVPSPAAGTVVSIVVAEGSKVSEGDDLLVLALAAPAPSAAPAQAAAPQAAAAASTSTMDVTVPDIGGSEGVDVIEVCVAE
ncbi:MAG: pyruvate dehydrogenase E2 component (dihydrolipoamide acetyltransferase), partial [Lentisphaeria bacterium]